MPSPTELNPASPSEDQPSGPAEAPAGDQTPSAVQSAPDGVAARPVIAVAVLTAHPGNVRRDMDLSAEFLASIRENGVLVPLRITPADGGYRVIDGHRRLAAAIEAGLAEVPADLAGDRAGDEPGQYLDMWTAHRHRNALAPIEEADALFAARAAGATRARIRKATGLKTADVTTALAAAKLSPHTRAALDEADHQLTIDQLAVVAEFQDDPQAVSRLAAAAWTGAFEHEAERIRQNRAEQAEQDRLRRDLEEAGVTVTDTLPAGAHPLAGLRHDGEDLTPESHASCPGRGVFFRSWDPTAPNHYCCDPAGHGHTYRHGDPATSDITAGPAGAASTPGPAGRPDVAPADDSRRLVIQGNKAWKAATQVRHRWLTASLFARRTAPREAAPFVARQLLTMPDPLRSGLAAAPSRALFSQITGQPADRWLDACDTAPAGRVALLLLGPVVTAYEQAMTDGEGRNTWRTDRYSPCPRDQAGRYLAFLASAGYQLSDIERAVVDGMPYTGETPPGDPLSEDAGPAAARPEPFIAGQPAPDADSVSSGPDPLPPHEPGPSGEDLTGNADPGTADCHAGETGSDTGQAAA
jgi:ParB family chromosome partitioning protein